MNCFILYTFAALGMIETLVLTLGGIIIIAAIRNSKEEWRLQKSSLEIMNNWKENSIDNRIWEVMECQSIVMRKSRLLKK